MKPMSRKIARKPIRFLREVAGRWPGEIAEMDDGSADWLVERGIAEHVQDDAATPAVRAPAPS